MDCGNLRPGDEAATGLNGDSETETGDSETGTGNSEDWNSDDSVDSGTNECSRHEKLNRGSSRREKLSRGLS